jgi:anti-sigma B factor antagonist
MDESLLHSWQVDEHVHVISLKGEHDLTNVQELRDAIASAFQSGSTVILDLTDATLIDSMVLGAIAEARMELLGSGGRHRLAISVRPDTHVARVLAIGLDGLVEAYDNLDAAYLAAT